MTTAKDILEALELILPSRYPQIPVYSGALPAGAAKPCMLLELTAVDVSDANRFLLHVTEKYRITIINETDAGPLQGIRQELISLFSQGYLETGDRHIRTQVSSGGGEEDKDKDKDVTQIDLLFEYIQSRPCTEEELPLMESVQTKILPKG